MYAFQLRDVFSDVEAKELDTTHLHKLFIHSIFVFMHVNLAACSCEGGEGIIAIMKNLFRFKNRTLNEAFRRVLLRLLYQEKSRFQNALNSVNNVDNSKVFSKEFIEQYSPKSLEVIVYLKDFEYLKIS